MALVIVGLLALAGATALGLRRQRDPLVDPASRTFVRDARRRLDDAEIDAVRLGRNSTHFW